MTPVGLGAADVRTIASALLRAPVDDIARIDRGHGHQNWLIRSGVQDFLVKVSNPGFPVTKIESAALAWRQATSAGVAVPELLMVFPATSRPVVAPYES